MNRRTEVIMAIQHLSREEGSRQPSAEEWLATQDALAHERCKASRADPGSTEGDAQSGAVEPEPTTKPAGDSA